MSARAIAGLEASDRVQQYHINEAAAASTEAAILICVTH